MLAFTASLENVHEWWIVYSSSPEHRGRLTVTATCGCFQNPLPQTWNRTSARQAAAERFPLHRNSSVVPARRWHRAHPMKARTRASFTGTLTSTPTEHLPDERELLTHHPTIEELGARSDNKEGKNCKIPVIFRPRLSTDAVLSCSDLSHLPQHISISISGLF